MGLSAPITERWLVGILAAICLSLVSTIWVVERDGKNEAIKTIVTEISEIKKVQSEGTQARVLIQADVAYLIKAIEEMKTAQDDYRRLIIRTFGDPDTPKRPSPLFGR